MSKVYSFQAVQTMPITKASAWDFFSNPKNLKDITPAQMGFVIKNEQSNTTMYEGQIIEYTVKPVLGIPLYWMTEITHVQEGNYFVDEQRFGPYTLWHHKHFFKEVTGGVQMTDLVHYKIPYWFFGDIANTLFVKAQLKKIFDYRFAIIEERFGKWGAPIANLKQ